MQSYKYDKAIAPESKNGGGPALGGPRRSGGKRALLVCLDLFCLFMGELPLPAPSGGRAAIAGDVACTRFPGARGRCPGPLRLAGPA